MGPIGAQEMIFIFVLALLLFGPKKLPELGRMLGKGLSEFRRAKNELKSTFESHMQELERETRTAEQSQKPASNYSSGTDYSTGTDYSSAQYPYPYDEYGRQGSAYESSSGPYDSTQADGQSTPDTTSTATPAETATKLDDSQPLPVSGTVPRSKVVEPAEPVSVPPEETRSA